MKKLLGKRSIIGIVVSSLIGPVAVAQNKENAAVIKTESGIDFTPGLNASLKYDDNIASANTDTEDSMILVVNPALKAELLSGNSVYSAEAGIEYGEYFSSSDDNYLDGLLRLKADVELNQSNRFNITGTYIGGHEDRGTGIFEGAGNIQDEPNTYDVYAIGGYYEYGARSTAARLRLNGKYLEKEYKRYEELTQYKNYSETTYGGTFFYDVSPTASLVADVQRIDTEYDKRPEQIELENRDSSTTNYLLGADWEATASTEGKVRVGYQQKSFDNSSREDFSGLTWDADMTWRPLSYSAFTLKTGQSSKDPNLLGDYVRETNYGVAWKHEWTELFSSNLGYERIEEDFTGIIREDRTSRYQASVSYSFARWLLMRVGLDINDSTSTDEIYKFDRNIYYINAEMTL
ncbi:outer membrane beta-barrel protein [Shewanella sp. TC10]|uniref:outer membrane beta-barrel protein n=1 Tax=Shewanella sp. TC10 TaxID=1419739 RepID=UPI001892AA6A|nr:outer membrane beta-barrel protein [Shewanella sp. TC10]